MAVNLEKVVEIFSVKAGIVPYGNGHINDTYLREGNPGYILQRINTNVFKDPNSVMENIVNVTEYLRAEIVKNGGDPERETMNVIKTKLGKNCYMADSSNYFRMYKFVSNSVSFDTAEDLSLLFEAGKSFGKFQRMLDGFDAGLLLETIVDFHNTPKRIEQLEAAIKKN